MSFASFEFSVNKIDGWYWVEFHDGDDSLRVRMEKFKTKGQAEMFLSHLRDTCFDFMQICQRTANIAITVYTGKLQQVLGCIMRDFDRPQVTVEEPVYRSKHEEYRCIRFAIRWRGDTYRDGLILDTAQFPRLRDIKKKLREYECIVGIEKVTATVDQRSINLDDPRDENFYRSGAGKPHLSKEGMKAPFLFPLCWAKYPVQALDK